MKIKMNCSCGNENFILNENNKKENPFENNQFDLIINDYYNNNFKPKNNIEFKKIIEFNTLPNQLNLNSLKDILSNNCIDKLNNGCNLLKDYISKNYEIKPYINYLSSINDLLITRIKLLNIINSFDNIYFFNTKKDLNFLNNNSLINNNKTPKLYNIYSLTNNNILQIDNKIPKILLN